MKYWFGSFGCVESRIFLSSVYADVYSLTSDIRSLDSARLNVVSLGARITLRLLYAQGTGNSSIIGTN